MSDLDRYFDSFGRQLTAAQPRRSHRALALGGTGTIATAAVAATLLIGSGHAPVDAMAAARAAMTVQEGEVLRMRVNITAPGVSITYEQVTASNPKRWRVSKTVDGAHTEDAFKPGERSSLQDGKLDIQVGVNENHLYATEPSFRGLGTDPAVGIQALLADGTLTDQGEVESGGRVVRRFTHPQGEVVFDVDPKTFAPIAGSSTPATDGVRYHYTIERYEKLPLDAETAKLLEIQPPAGTEIVRRPVQDAAAKRRR